MHDIIIEQQQGRIDAVLAKENLGYSRSKITDWLNNGQILVNQKK